MVPFIYGPGNYDIPHLFLSPLLNKYILNISLPKKTPGWSRVTMDKIQACTIFVDLEPCKLPIRMKKYFSEKNALTVMTSLFCLVMMIIALSKQSIWESVAFALAFSFSIEILCHRVKENK
jgi:hypothetical protein